MGLSVGVYVNSGNTPDEAMASRSTAPSTSKGDETTTVPENGMAASRHQQDGKHSTEGQKQGAGDLAEEVSPSNDPGKDRAGERSQPIAKVAEPGPVAQSGTQHHAGQQITMAQTEERKKAQGLIADNTDAGNTRNLLNTPPAQAAVSGVSGNETVLLPAGASVVREENESAVFSPSFERKLPALVAQKKIELILPQEEKADPVALMLAKLERREQEVRAQEEKQAEKKRDERNKGENLWTSVGVAAGSFDPVVSRNPAPPASSFTAGNLFASNASKEVEAKGATYAVGVNMGTRLSERWVLQGGVNYLTQTSDYTQNGLVPSGLNDNTLKLPSNFKNESKMTGSEDGDIREASVVDTPPYNVNNNVRYLSVPMQAGYMIVNKNFGFQLNAGVSTDLLLQNTITATVDGEAVDSDFEGNDYRQVNLSGLMGTELSYRFGRRYRIALNPGLRYPFSNIYKSDDFRATRLSFDVGLRFRYIFK
jgi:hypothetical protein